jgi:hypothetical protein
MRAGLSGHFSPRAISKTQFTGLIYKASRLMAGFGSIKSDLPSAGLLQFATARLAGPDKPHRVFPLQP